METQGEAPFALPPWPVCGTHGAEMFGAAPAEGRGGGFVFTSPTSSLPTLQSKFPVLAEKWGGA